MASDTIIGESLALSPYQELLKENEQLRALLREANKWIGRDCTSVREQIAELAPLCNRIDAALQEQK